MTPARLLLSFFAGIFCLVAFRVDAAPVRDGHVEAELVAERGAIQAGQPFTVGLRLRMDEHWHTYWQNPGDSGQATAIEWHLPPGFSAGEIQWPTPERIPTPPFMTYGYSGEVLLLTEIRPPADLPQGENVTLRADANWLVCSDMCIPGSAALTLELPVQGGPGEPPLDPAHAEAFRTARERLPASPAEAWRATFSVEGEELVARIEPPAGVQPPANSESIYFFATEAGVIEPAAPQGVSWEDGALTVRLKRAATAPAGLNELSGVLVADGGFPPALPGRSVAIVARPPVVGQSTAVGGTTLLAAIAGAFLGGLILNLMPCVFPVLSIKIVSFVKQAAGDRARIFRHGLVFAAGVLVSFWILAGVLLALRAGGEQIGWGFQLQSPVVVMVLAGVMFVMALSLFGVFEIGGGVAGAIGRTGGGGYFSSFGTGVLATAVATPCTAPFMGSALAFALPQPPPVALSVFTALGAGMATPYVVLSGFPALLRFLPKPGGWMETFKQAMAFPLLATVVWLAWVLTLQVGAEGLWRFLAGLLLLGLAAWVLGRWSTPVRSGTVRVAARCTSLIVAAIAIWTAADAANFQAGDIAGSSAGEKAGGLAWEEYSPARFEELRRSGQPVFIDFTAAWCLTCKVNEFRAFRSEEVRNRFEQLGVATLRADWTSYDPEITAALARYGRNSVPLYVLYGPGADAKAQVLPQLLSPGIVLDALEDVGMRTSARRVGTP